MHVCFINQTSCIDFGYTLRKFNTYQLSEFRDYVTIELYS